MEWHKKKFISSPFLQDTEKCGEIFFSLNYLPKAGRLAVDIIRCRELFKKDTAKKFGTLQMRKINELVIGMIVESSNFKKKY